MSVIQLTRLDSLVSETLDPTLDGRYVLFTDVVLLINNMKQRHALAMDKLRASFAPSFNTMSTISSRLVSRDESPGTVKRMTHEQIVSQERGCRFWLDKLRQSDSIQFEELEI